MELFISKRSFLKGEKFESIRDPNPNQVASLLAAMGSHDRISLTGHPFEIGACERSRTTGFSLWYCRYVKHTQLKDGYYEAKVVPLHQVTTAFLSFLNKEDGWKRDCPWREIEVRETVFVIEAPPPLVIGDRPMIRRICDKWPRRCAACGAELDCSLSTSPLMVHIAEDYYSATITIPFCNSCKPDRSEIFKKRLQNGIPMPRLFSGPTGLSLLNVNKDFAKEFYLLNYPNPELLLKAWQQDTPGPGLGRLSVSLDVIRRIRATGQ